MGIKKYQLVSGPGLIKLCSSVVYEGGSEISPHIADSTKIVADSAVEMLSRLYLMTLPRKDPVLFLEAVVDKVFRRLTDRYGEVGREKLLGALIKPILYLHGPYTRMEYVTYYEMVYGTLPESNSKSGFSWLSQDMDDLEKAHGRSARTRYLTILFELFKRGMNTLPRWREIKKLSGKPAWEMILSNPTKGNVLSEKVAQTLHILGENHHWASLDLSDLLVYMSMENKIG